MLLIIVTHLESSIGTSNQKTFYYSQMNLESAQSKSLILVWLEHFMKDSKLIQFVALQAMSHQKF